MMDFFFYSTSEHFHNYHRRREIEAIAEKVGVDGCVIYFRRPRFIFSGRNKCKEQDFNNVKIRSLFTVLPLSYAFKSNLLLLFFVKLPILLQVLFYRVIYRVHKLNLYHWFYKPDQFFYMPRRNLIYLQYDNYKGDNSYFFSGSPEFDITLNACIEYSVLCLFSSEQLIQDLGYSEKKNVFYYPNALDRAIVPDGIDHSRSKAKHINVGFIGQIDNSFNSHLLELLVNKYKEFDFTLIGPLKNSDVKRIVDLNSNIKLLGFVPYNELPKHIAKFDIGICPYKFEDFNYYRNPLKVYEFFSYGIPVVCSICDVDKITHPYLSVADSEDNFVEAIQHEITNNTAEKITWRCNFSRENCWDNRADFVLTTLKEKL
jgi:hypothetical protein